MKCKHNSIIDRLNLKNKKPFHCGVCHKHIYPLRFVYKGQTYPQFISEDEGHEIQHVLIPEISGDYFLAQIDSGGGYKLIELVASADVKIESTY